MLEKISNKQLEGLHGKPILVDVVYEKNVERKPIVIFSHGFKGFKDWGHFNRTAEWFANEGFVFVKFNFSHGGHSIVNPEECTDIEAFGHNNFSIEMDDLGVVIDWVMDNPELSNDVDQNQLFLIGHSRGGGITVLKAAEDDRIKKIVTWASVSDFENRYTEEEIAIWKELGKVEVVNGRTGQVLPMHYQMFEDFQKNIKRLSIPNNAKKLEIPALIIHGANDEAVSFDEAINLSSWIPQSELIEIDDSGHTFEGKHPFGEKEEYPENLKTVIEETIVFLQN